VLLRGALLNILSYLCFAGTGARVRREGYMNLEKPNEETRYKRLAPRAFHRATPSESAPGCGGLRPSVRFVHGGRHAAMSGFRLSCRVPGADMFCHAPACLDLARDALRAQRLVRKLHSHGRPRPTGTESAGISHVPRCRCG